MPTAGVGEETADATPGGGGITWSERAQGLAAAATVFFAGFGCLLYFWITDEHPPHLPGLFDYRSAVVGDALLLPVLVGVLTVSAVHLRRDAVSGRLAVAGAFGLLGLAAGVITQLVWLSDPAPRLNWTWTKPGEFETPGDVHAIFLIVVSGVVAFLLTFVLVSVRRRRRQVGAAASERATVVVVATAVALIGLILRDNAAADETDAGLATLIAVLLAALLAVGLALWGLGRASWRATLVGLTAGLGIYVLCFDWPPQHPGLLGPAVLPLALLASFLSEPLKRQDFLRPSGAVAILLASEGAVALAMGRTTAGEGITAAVIVVVAAAWVTLLPVLIEISGNRQLRFDLLGVAPLVAFIVSALVVGGAIRFEFDESNALPAVTGIEFFFDIFVFVLFRQRFRRIVEEEADQARRVQEELTGPQYFARETGAIRTASRRQRSRLSRVLARSLGVVTLAWAALVLPADDSDDRPIRRPRRDTGGFVDSYPALLTAALAGLCALIVLLIQAAGPLNIDENVRGDEPSFRTLALTLGIAVAVVVLGRAVNLIQPPPSDGKKRARGDALHVPRPADRAEAIEGSALALALASLTAVGWGLVCWLIFPVDFNLPGLAAIPALTYGILTAESVLVTSVGLQLVRAGRAARLLAGITALSVASATFWLFSVGIWSDSGPAEIWRLTLISVGVLGGTWALALSVGLLLAKAGPASHITPQPARENAFLDHGL